MSRTVKELRASLYDLLKPCENGEAPLGRTTLEDLNADEIRALLRIATRPLSAVPPAERPAFPSDSLWNKPVRDAYKRGMTQYISSYGLGIAEPINVSSSMLEAIANYIDSRKGTQA